MCAHFTESSDEDNGGRDTTELNQMISAAASGARDAEQKIVQLLGEGVRSYFVHHMGIADVAKEVDRTFLELFERLHGADVPSAEEVFGLVVSIMQEQTEQYQREARQDSSSFSGGPPTQENGFSAALQPMVDAVYGLSEIERQILDGLYRLGETSAETQSRLGLQEEEFATLKRKAKSQLGQARRQS